MNEINYRGFTLAKFKNGKPILYTYEDYDFVASVYKYKGRWFYSLCKKGIHAVELGNFYQLQRELESDCIQLTRDLNKQRYAK